MNICQDIEFFDAAQEASREAFELWRAVFTSWSEETCSIIADRLQSGLRAGTVRLPAVRLRREGKLIAALRLEYSSYAGPVKGEFRRGVHVGEVAVSPELQSCGAGTFLMEKTVELLKEETPGADFACLGGYVNFYRRFGFVPVDGVVRLELPLTPERGGTKRFPLPERLPRPESALIRPFDPAADGGAVTELQKAAPGERIFDRKMLEREFIFRKATSELDCFVTPGADGKPCGYLFRSGSGIYSMGYTDSKTRDILFAEALHRIADSGAQSLTVSCDPDGTEAYFREKQLPFRRIAAVGGICSAMKLELKH